MIRVPFNLKFVGSENARPGLGNPGFESRRVALQLGHLFTTFGLLGVMFGHTVLPQADEGNPLLQQVGVGRLASSGALGHGLLGDADLSGPLDNGVLQDGAFTLLSPQRLGNLSGKKIALNVMKDGGKFSQIKHFIIPRELTFFMVFINDS